MTGKTVKKTNIPVEPWMKTIELTYMELYQYRQPGAMGQNPLSIYEIEKYIQYEGDLHPVIVKLLMVIDPVIMNFDSEVKIETKEFKCQ